MTLLVFWRVSSFEFINFDDNSYVSENRFVQSGLNLRSIGAAFTQTFNGHWHPFTMLSYMADTSLYGRSAGGYHLTNMLIHIANVVLLFLLLRELTGALGASAFVAALFAVHPLHVESVVWIASRKDVLSTFFFLLLLFAYGGYVRDPTRARYGVMMMWMMCGLLSKAMLVTVPALLLLLDYWPLGRYEDVHRERAAYFRRFRKLLIEKAPLFALAVVFSIITVATQSSAGTMTSIADLPLLSRLANGLHAYGFYLSKTLAPSGLAPFYPHGGNQVSFLFAGVSLAVMVGITIVSLLTIRRAPYIFVGWFWFVGMLAPVSGLMQAGIQSYADRYTYVPLIGIFIAVAWGSRDLMRGRPRLVLEGRAMAATVVLACVVLSWWQVGRWRDDVTLFEHTLSVTEENYVAHMILGNAYFKDDRTEDAITQYTRALSIEPNDVSTYTSMGVALSAQGRDNAAQKAYETALAMDPDHLPTHGHFGAMLLRQGRIEAAAGHFEKALELDPYHLTAINGLGLARAYQGKLQVAERYLRQGVDLAPNSLSLHKDLALVLAQQGKRGEALNHFQMAARLDPSDADTHNNLAIVLAEESEFDQAIFHFEEALRLAPDHATAKANLERCLAARDEGRTPTFPGNP